MKKCKRCGFENVDEMKFCGKCGNTLNEASSEIENSIPEAIKKRKKLLCAIIGIAALLVIAGTTIYILNIENINLSKANSMISRQEYGNALNILEKYKDNSSEINNIYLQCKYDHAKSLYTQGNYAEAQPFFKDLNDFKDSISLYEECEFMNSNKGQFLSDFATGLETRWNMTENETSADAENVLNGKYVDAELSILEKYDNTIFDDEAFNKYAHEYINALKESKQALTYYQTDYTKYFNTWQKTYKDRSVLISYFLKNYPVNIDSQYDSIKQEFLTNAQAVNEEIELKQTINNMIKENGFKCTKDSYGWATWETTVENRTSKTFDFFYLNANIIDSEGVIVDTTCTNTINNFAPGQKVVLSFTTDKKAASIESSAEYYIK